MYDSVLIARLFEERTSEFEIHEEHSFRLLVVLSKKLALLILDLDSCLKR
jgi:hypothetical protein